MLTVHHLNNSRSLRVLWLLEELELPYEIRAYQRDPRTMLAPASLKQVHPLGKSPLVSDGDHTVAESGAIVEYVLDRYGQGRLRPAPDDPGLLRYRFFLHYAEGSVMPVLLLALVFGRMPQEPMPFFVRPVVKAIAEQARNKFIGPQMKLHLDFLETELKDRTWLLGDTLSGADIQMSFPMEAIATRADLGQYPQLGAYLERIRARPAYKRALDKAGPFDLGSF